MDNKTTQTIRTNCNCGKLLSDVVLYFWGTQITPKGFKSLYICSCCGTSILLNKETEETLDDSIIYTKEDYVNSRKK